MSNNEIADKFAGCLLGGAVGDALGWPVEFMSMDEIALEELGWFADDLTSDPFMDVQAHEALLNQLDANTMVYL